MSIPAVDVGRSYLGVNGKLRIRLAKFSETEFSEIPRIPKDRAVPGPSVLGLLSLEVERLLWHRPHLLHSTARVPEADLLKPTTCPRLLMPSAELLLPPGKVPRSLIWPSSHKNAWNAPEAVSLWPTTCPRLLMSLASLRSPPGSVPRSVIESCLAAPCCPKTGCAPSNSATTAHTRTAFRGLISLINLAALTLLPLPYSLSAGQHTAPTMLPTHLPRNWCSIRLVGERRITFSEVCLAPVQYPQVPPP